MLRCTCLPLRWRCICHTEGQTVNITFLFLITCLLFGECTYHKFDNTQAHWKMNFIGRRRRVNGTQITIQIDQIEKNIGCLIVGYSMSSDKYYSCIFRITTSSTIYRYIKPTVNPLYKEWFNIFSDVCTDYYTKNDLISLQMYAQIII